MLNSLRHWLIRLLGGYQTPAVIPIALGQPEHRTAVVLHDVVADAVESPHKIHVVPYDEGLLGRSHIQWQFGDWDSLTQLDCGTLQHHPDRAELALLAAAGRLQTNKIDEARQYIRLAQDWGISKNLLARILSAGVHNSLGRVAAIGNEQHRASLHFQSAIAIGFPGSETQLLAQARINYQCQQLGLSPIEILPNVKSPA